MAAKTLSSDQVLHLLAEGPRRIAAATDGLLPAQLRAAPAQGEWSANEVLAHLRSCADVWGGCIAEMASGNVERLRAVNPTTWIQKTDYLGLEFHASFHAFATQRAGLLAELRALSPEGWARSATVTGAGRPIERTVLSYAQWLATHERTHLKQIERIVAAARKERAEPPQQ